MSVMVAKARGLTPIEEGIRARAREFDLGPLLRLLEAEGYTPERILFESNTEVVSSSSLVEAVHFHASPMRRVVVTLNLGLMGSNALLPSYFMELAEQSPRPEAFFDFIRFFDHRLLEGFTHAVYPEHDRGMLGDWERVKGFYFRMLGVGTVTTLQWLFQLYFPELRVDVSRNAFRNSTASHALRTGISHLDGTAVLGRHYESDAAGFRVELIAEEETNGAGEAWPHIVQRRLTQTVLPLLAPSRLPLAVALTVLAHASWARIYPEGFLGYERLRGGVQAGYRMVIFQGDTGDSEPSRFLPLPDKLPHGGT
ncbi:type VI secretion system baseplate subunit TssG [Myxococcaceae bacterium GXIMD 01537]